MTKSPKPRSPKDIPEEREITLPPRDFPAHQGGVREGIRHARSGYRDRAQRLLPARESERGKARDQRQGPRREGTRGEGRQGARRKDDTEAASGDRQQGSAIKVEK